MKRGIFFYFLLLLIFFGCTKDTLSPKPSSSLTNEDLWINAAYGGGLLGRAYQNLNYNFEISMDNYTDNAVPSVVGSNNLALGNWTLEGNPIGSWATSYSSIRYLNLFLAHAQTLPYLIGTPSLDSLERNNRIGEAFFLRAWFQWQLLHDYAGYADGTTQCMGFPIVTDTLSSASDALNLPRNSYEECVAQIVQDLDSAIVRLPLAYSGSDNITGISNLGRGSKLAAMSLKAIVYLFAASPAYGNSDQLLWKKAAQAAYDAISASGGLKPLSPYGNFDDYGAQDNVWIQPPYTSNGLEHQYYPPSLFGTGDINPSQNLVDAFPAKDGYPIGESTLYDAMKPYENRDPRFERFIFYNNDNYAGSLIETFSGGADSRGGLSQLGTRTGYYMKKGLSDQVSLSPGNETSDLKFKVFINKTRLYLVFAEAANEAFGPSDISLGFSAYDALKKIRERAGIDSDAGQPGSQDAYLEEQAALGKDNFREVVHNERRIELSFEGDRFWDLRRWNDNLNTDVNGVVITKDGTGQFSYQYREIEKLNFQDYMRYVPLPFSETLIMDKLEQNKGWR